MRRRLIPLALLLIGSAFVVASSATAHTSDAGAASPAVSVSVFASGFNNPRGLTFGPDGNLYVAEGGLGGSDVESTSCPEGVVQGAAFPHSGSVGDPVNGGRISMITPAGGVSTVASGLPTTKTGPALGGLVWGVSSVAFVGDQLYALLPGGGCAHGNPGAPVSVAKIGPGNSWAPVANLTAFQMANPVAAPDPGDFDPDGTWFSMGAAGGMLYPMDSNHGELDRVDPSTGQVSRVLDISAALGHVVPTAIAQRGAVWYISNLGLFPDDSPVAGDESVYQLTPSGHFRVYATGLEKVLALAFDGGKLYALEMSATAGFPTPGSGQIVRVTPDGVDVVYSGLILPTGMAIGPDGSFYVTDHGFGFGAGAGRVLKITVGS